MGRTAVRRSRDPARKHQKYHESGPARPGTCHRRHTKWRRFCGGKAKDGQNGAPRAWERSPLTGQLLPSTVRACAEVELDAATSQRTQKALFGRQGGRFSAPWFWRSASPAVSPVHGRSTTIPRRARTLLRGVGTPLAILKRASSPLDRELAQRTVFQQTLSDGRESPTHSPTPD